MKNLAVLLVAFSVAASPVQAHLGEDGDRIEISYGDLIDRHLRDDGTVGARYHKNKDRYAYFVLFDRNVSILEKIARVDGAEMSEKEIAKFLKANAGRGKWLPSNEANRRRFERSDHKAEAIYEKIDGKPALTFRSLATQKPSD
jgi:hypothetical protein